MKKMRAKMEIESVESHGTCETLQFRAVCASSYPDDGSDENNTYAKFTPTARLVMQVTNPDLLGVYKPGQVFYVDFTPAA